MDWHGFLKEILVEHGAKVKRPSGQTIVTEITEKWTLQPGSMLSVICGGQTYAFRADDGYTVQLDEDFALIGRAQPVDEAMYFFYPHIAALRLQKANLPND